MTDRNGIIREIEVSLGAEGSPTQAERMFILLKERGSITFDAADGYVLQSVDENIWMELLIQADAATTYTVTITDGGMTVRQEVHALDLEAACNMMERQMIEADSVTDGNPDCTPRTEWTCFLTEGRAECSLRTPGEQDSASWAKVVIEPASAVESEKTEI